MLIFGSGRTHFNLRSRTYDTCRKGESLDFGYGWSVDYQSVQLRKNMVPYVSKIRWPMRGY